MTKTFDCSWTVALIYSENPKPIFKKKFSVCSKSVANRFMLFSLKLRSGNKFSHVFEPAPDDEVLKVLPPKFFFLLINANPALSVLSLVQVSCLSVKSFWSEFSATEMNVV